MTDPQLSVIVCSYNGSRRIKNTLTALLQQKTTASWELLVVDDGSTDGTGDIARSMGVTVVDKGGNHGLSAARNAGIEASSSDIVAFTDDDVVPPDDWVESIVRAWADAPANVTGIGGTTTALDTDSLARRYVSLNNPLAPLERGTGGGIVKRLWNYFAQPAAPVGRRNVASLVGANMSFKRAALTGIGGFDPVIRFGGDEEDLCRRLRETYGETTLEVAPGITVAHDFDLTLKDTLRRSRAYGRGNGRDWARRGGVPAIRPLPVLLAGTLALGALNLKLAVLLTALLPVAVYRKTLRKGARNRRAEALLYPYIGALQELAATIGFVEEARRLKRRPS